MYIFKIQILKNVFVASGREPEFCPVLSACSYLRIKTFLVMKRTLLFLFASLCIMAFRQTAGAQCTTDAGTIQSYSASVCGEQDILLILNSDAVSDGNDVRQVVVFTGSDPLSGAILAVSPPGMQPTVVFPYDPAFAANSPLKVAPIAGNNDGSGAVDLNDPCLSVGPAVVVEYHDLPEVDIQPDNAVLTCATPSVVLTASSPGTGNLFTWNGPGGWTSIGPSPNVGVPGQYCVSLVDQNGCTAQACATVSENVNAPLVSWGAPGVLSCDNPVVTLSAMVSWPTSGYTVSWTGPGGFTSTELNPQVNAPGTYFLTVTDTVTDCYSSAAFSVFAEDPVTVGTVVTCGSDTLWLEVFTPPTFVPPFTYLWSDGSTGSQYPVIDQQPADLCVTVTDATGCQGVYCIPNIVIAQPPPLEITWSPGQINCNQQVWHALPSGGTPPYWYTPSVNGVPVTPTGDAIIATYSAVYSMTIVDAAGCSVTKDTFIEMAADQCVTISGRVFRDNDEDCADDPGEPSLSGWLVSATDGNNTYFATTDVDGNYEMSAYPGSIVVSLHAPDSTVWMPCAWSVDIGSQGTGATEVVDFPVKALVDCPVMDVSLGTAILRRCFDNNYYSVNYCNQGTVAATDAYVDISLDAYLELITATLPYTDLGNNVYRFQLGDVAMGECGAFNVRVKVSCDAVLGQTHCSEAHIYPDSLCVPNANWSGASVSVIAECDQDSVKFKVRNVGTANMSVPLEYVVIEDAIMYLEIHSPPLAVGDEYPIGFPANGATWRLVSNQEPYHPSAPALPTAWVEGCTVGGSGSFSTGFVQLFSDGDADPWLDVDCTANTGSFDPNDKQGFPIGYGAAHYIKPGTPLEYMIRFQNTGTDTAFTVVVRDTLSAWLDLATVTPGASSHPYRFEVYGPGILRFTFDNIMLPDSNVNEPASHGFVRFGVSPRPDVPLETDIYNNAGIYFDYNLPVITNTTWHRIGENFTVIGWRPTQPSLDLLIAPHPVSEEARIEISGLDNGTVLTLRILDLGGREIRRETVMAPSFQLRRNGLPSGLYILEIRDGQRLLGHAKLVVDEG